MTDLCPHDGDPHSCPPCQSARRGQDLVDDNNSWSREFPATYEGQCVECDLPIYVGQTIRLRRSGTRRAIHAGCTP